MSNSIVGAPLFALDIGTRNVLGLVARPDGDRLEILAIAVESHDERAMRDGQIHDVPKVVRAVRAVKEALETHLGARLTHCAIAAAGRALKTERAQATAEIGLEHQIDAERVRALELSAIEGALARLASSDDHCVGYSVVHYYLDGQPLANLVGQRAKTIAVELIATFLPRVVTDSLVAVCHQVGLEVQNLTLEPIAAINAAVPANMRALNLALVDVGAGTSDIALTQKGAVTAYAMVPKAGDALTEAIAEAFLLDFMEAERVKYALTGAETVAFTDVLGLGHHYAAEAVRQSVRPTLEHLVSEIAQQILALNGKAPAAAILIGGGAMFPEFGPLLASALGLPENRVAVRGTEMVKRLKSVPPLLEGPMGVTPVGIALSALEAPGFRFLTIYCDDRVLNLTDWGQATVQDALEAAGYDPLDFAERPAPTLALRLNGELRRFPASGRAGVRLLLDEQPVTLDHPLRDGARLKVVSGELEAGEPPLRVSDIIDLSPVPVTINGLAMDFPPLVKVNGTSLMGDRQLEEGDSLSIDRSLRALLVQAGLAEVPTETLRFWIDGEPQEYVLSRMRLTIDGAGAALTSEPGPGAVIEAAQERFPQPTLREVLPPTAQSLAVKLNDRLLPIPNPALELLLNGEAAGLDAPVPEGAQIRRQLGRRMTVGDVLPLLRSALGEGEDGELLITVDGKFADAQTAISATSLIEVLTEDEDGLSPGAWDVEALGSSAI